MIGFHKRFSQHNNRTQLTKDAINVPQRTHIRTRNLIIKPSAFQQKKHTKTLSFLDQLMSMTVGTHFQKYKSLHSKKSFEVEQRLSGFKDSQVKMAGGNRISRNLPFKKECLYQKSLKKAKSIDQRIDFQQSIKEIAGKKFLITKQSQLSSHPQNNMRLKTDLRHPQSATIIIELKKLFNNKAEYSFVHNHYEVLEKEEPIHSTAYTYLNQSERHLSHSHNLHTRTKSAQNKRVIKKDKKIQKKSITISENDFIPWVKQSERVLAQGQLEFENIFERDKGNPIY